MATQAVAVTAEPLTRWADWALLGGVLALALGTVLAILGVNAAGLLFAGVYILVLALLLLAVGGVLRALRP